MKAHKFQCVLPFIVFVLSTSAWAEIDKPNVTTQQFSVTLKASRIIYDPASNGATLTVANPQAYPVLIQSVVLNEEMKNKAPFIVTPPLIRLDAQQQSRLRIISMGADFPGDRETLQWLCVRGIPPRQNDLWAQDKNTGSAALKHETSVNVRLSVNNCIKLLVRPEKLGTPEKAAASLTWRHQGNTLTAVNTSPFYINLAELKVGNINISELSYIPPFGTHPFMLQGDVAYSQVQWRVVNDYGGKSALYKTGLK